jgi:hypothetical protein
VLVIWIHYLKLVTRVLLQKNRIATRFTAYTSLKQNVTLKEKNIKSLNLGVKPLFLITQSMGVIVGVLNFTDILHDSKILPQAVEQHERLTGTEATNIFLDRG